MDDAAVKRLSAVAGGCVFTLALLAQLARENLGAALLTALASGLAAGVIVYLAGTIVLLSHPVVKPEAPPPPVPPSADDTQELPDLTGIAALEETRQVPREEVEAAAGLPGEEGADTHQTVRLDEQGLENLIPGITAEDLEREKEDLARMMEEQGIEGGGAPSENTTKGTS